ncbi:MAG: polymerase sigma factor RpoE [Myxococcaceae bacterium]|nr:polymerase sigma factor RpoE [Myxococcaceae bacterium]
MTGHPRGMRQATAGEPEEPTSLAAASREREPVQPSFAQVYEQHFEFVWRSARRLGVPEASLDDVVQDVFVTVYRRLEAFEGRAQLRTWLFGILRFTVRDLRRSARRKPTEELSPDLPDTALSSPQDSLAHAQGTRLLHAVLLELNDDAREVFVLSELEQLSAPEVAAALALNVNTVYSRLRSARKDFEAALKRLRCREASRSAAPRASVDERERESTEARMRTREPINDGRGR